jgi:VanZ family protein
LDDSLDRPTGRQARRWLVLLVAVQLVAVYWPRVEVVGPVTWTDKVVHVLLFLAPTLAAVWSRLRWRWVVVALLALHAPVSELAQHYLLPNRSGDVWDVVSDLGGVALGVGLGVGLERVRGVTSGVVGSSRRRW